MSKLTLTPAALERTAWILDASGIVDLLVPPRAAGKAGRKGRLRENVWLFCFGVMLASRLGLLTTVETVYRVLTEMLSVDDQLRYGILRRTTTTNRAVPRDHQKGNDLSEHGKPVKRVWDSLQTEEIGYDDLHYATVHIRKSLDYGHGSAPNLKDDERAARQRLVEQIADALINVTTVDRTGDYWAIDATGQWAWTRGSEKGKAKLSKRLKGTPTPEELDEALELAAIELPEPDELDAPAAPAPASSRKCADAAWGYKTSKSGAKEVGFGFHQHTIVRVPDPSAPADSEPLLVDGFVITPANADVAVASLGLVERVLARHPGRMTLIGDKLYTNLRAERWAVPLARLGVTQALDMRTDNHGILGVLGGRLQHGWLYRPKAPLEDRPVAPDSPSAPAADWEDFYEATEAFNARWAMDRKETGLLSGTSKWICPAMANRVGCPARGQTSVQVAIESSLPVVQPPADWADRACCTQRTVDFTPEPTDPKQQRKLMQRFAYGTRRWGRSRNRRSFVEGVFGILKNPSRQRLTRGHNRLPGLAIATLIAALKIAVYNEQTLRSWHDDTKQDPSDHRLLLPEPEYHGYVNISEEHRTSIIAQHWAGASPAAMVPAPREHTESPVRG